MRERRIGIETTLNAQTQEFLRAEDLACMIKEGRFEERFAVQIYNFFTDLPLQDVARFAVEHGIADGELLKYYEKFVKATYSNPELEEMFGGA
ncbi:hypothetical protein [Desulfovirgula thermocuniculi]|uniref:hypothetical protein n=1 Tax=Desulfovirgula thermocuniculi TaxID=348842 RepID=UPI0004029176|nr:hypothetical protein [Desulfovirgula thermocuniculi]